VIFNYIDQARMQLDGRGTVLQEISDGNETVLFGKTTVGARALICAGSSSRMSASTNQSPSFSGGERARLMLAKVLRARRQLLILDEPTNDLDLPSLRMLEEALADFDGTVLVVQSMIGIFLDRICDQVVAFEEWRPIHATGQLFVLPRKEEGAGRQARGPGRASPKPRLEHQSPSSTPKPARSRKLTFKEQRELEGMEAAILAAEARVQDLETTLNDPEFHATAPGKRVAWSRTWKPRNRSGPTIRALAGIGRAHLRSLTPASPGGADIPVGRIP